MPARKPNLDDLLTKEAAATRDMMIIVKSRLIQRAMLAEARRDQAASVKYHGAAAHLELLLADEYAEQADRYLEFRSRLSAASCFWMAGQIDVARQLLAVLPANFPESARSVELAMEELEHWSAQRPKRHATATKRKPRRTRAAS